MIAFFRVLLQCRKRLATNTSKSVAQILDKYGLSWKRATKDGERGYRVNVDSWNKMKAYAERRYRKSPE